MDILEYTARIADNGILVTNGYINTSNVFEHKEGESCKDCYVRAFNTAISQSIGAIIEAIHGDSPGKTDFYIKVEIK